MVSTKAYGEHKTHGSSVLKGLYDFVQNQFWSGFELILACLCLKLGICFSYFHWLWAQSMSGPSSPRPCGLRCSMWQTPGCGGWHYEVSCICSSERCRARHPCPHMARHPSWWYHRQHPQRRAVGMCISWSHDEGQFLQHFALPLNLRDVESRGKITTIQSESVFKWCVWIFTFWVFVVVCDIHTFVWANSLGADAVTNCVLVNMDHSECSTSCPLPEDYITVHLEQE